MKPSPAAELGERMDIEQTVLDRRLKLARMQAQHLGDQFNNAVATLEHVQNRLRQLQHIAYNDDDAVTYGTVTRLLDDVQQFLTHGRKP